MDFDRTNKYDQLYNIKLTELYEFVTDVMRDFGYSLHRTIRDHEQRRRIEHWVYQSKEEIGGVVWVEIVKPGDTLDPYMTTDVLRTMNDENVTRLFFFTNSSLTPSEKEVLEGTDHYIFGTEEIVETLTMIDSKRSVKVFRKRKNAKVPSGITLLKNYLKTNLGSKLETKLKTSAAPELTNQYIRLIRKVLNEIDKIADIDDILPETKEKLKRIQYELLPELVKTPSYIFTRQFSHLRNSLFTLVEYTVVYIGNVIEYESEEDLKKNRDVIEEILDRLSTVDAQVLDYKAEMIFSAEKISVKIILTSGIFAFIALLILIVIRFAK